MVEEQGNAKAMILEKLTGIFRIVFEDPALVITPQTTAGDVTNWDSLAHVQLIMSVEKAFGLRFPLGELQAMKNVSDLIASIEKKTAAP